jgi:hypothetical protein
MPLNAVTPLNLWEKLATARTATSAMNKAVAETCRTGSAVCISHCPSVHGSGA